MGRTSGYDRINFVIAEVPGQKSYCWLYPETSWIRNKKITPNPCTYLLKEATVRTGHESRRCCVFPAKPAFNLIKNIVRLPYRKPNYLCLHRNILFKRRILNGEGGIFGSKDMRLPAARRQVLHEFQPALYTTPSAGRPIVGNDQYFFHRGLEPDVDAWLCFSLLLKNMRKRVINILYHHINRLRVKPGEGIVFLKPRQLPLGIAP